MQILNRDGAKKRRLRNLIKRGDVWYFKMMSEGKCRQVSLGTPDLELAIAKRNQMEDAALAKEWDKVKGVQAPAGSVAEVLERFRQIGGATERTIGAYASSLMTVIRVGLGKPDLEPEDCKLTLLTRKLVRDYQDAVRSAYEQEASVKSATEGRANVEKERRMARDRADRTSKSTFNQAKCVFAPKRDLIERYREAGISVPDSVKEFCAAGAVGKMSSKQYFPPSAEQLAQTFREVENLRGVDPEAFNLFWVALATGCRRNELADMRVGDIQEIEGRLWVSAGLGKDGEQIRVPVINWPVHPASARVPADVVREILTERKEPTAFLFLGNVTARYDEMPDRLNAWLKRMGWNDEKKLHGLRSFIGCKLYVKNPRLAQLYLRHKSIATTEKYYSAFLRLQDAFKFDEDLGPALRVLPAAELAAN
jgi:integrase